MNTAPTTPLCDPLLAFMPLPYRAEFYPFGFPVSVASNSRLVLDAAEESWAGFRKQFDERPIEIRCLVTAAGDGTPPAPIVRAQGNLLISVAGAENFHCCDLVSGFATAWVTGSVAANSQYFRYHFLEAMASCLLHMLHLVDVHAACVSLDGHGVLLAGDSGAGKSSLAYACARRGWVYTSDDGISLVRRSGGRTVLGNSRLFRFRKTAGELFPEFRRFTDIRNGNGKPTIEVRTDSLPAVRTALESHVDYLVFLNRRDEAEPNLHPVSQQETRKRLFFNPWPLELPMHAEWQAAIERLLTAPAYEMRYRDLDSAVDRLEQLVRGGS
jgi:hypothetical protein